MSMSSTNYLKIHYGPNESFHTFAHRPQKLKSLRDTLRRLGYRVDLVPNDIINYCMIEMNGFDIFQCNINDLMFNQPIHQDPVGQQAVKAVVAATSMMIKADSNRWVMAMLEDLVFKTIYSGSQKERCLSKSGQENEIYQLASFDECFECCKNIDCSVRQAVDQDVEDLNDKSETQLPLQL